MKILPSDDLSHNKDYNKNYKRYFDGGETPSRTGLIATIKYIVERLKVEKNKLINWNYLNSKFLLGSTSLLPPLIFLFNLTL